MIFGVPNTFFHFFSRQVLANFSALSTTPPIRIQKTELRGITIDQLLVSLSLWTFCQALQENDHKKRSFRETKKPTLAKSWHWGSLHWWTLWKIELRIGVRHMKNLPTMEISWILTHSTCTRPISGSLNQRPEIMEEKAVATLSW